MSTTHWQKRMELPGRVTFLDGNGELPKLEVTAGASNAEIYLHGAHITHFQRKGEPPLLFLSQVSRFQAGQPIRGGVPIIFPWFGPREGANMHGFARTTDWELREMVPFPDGDVCLQFVLPDCPEASLLPPFSAEYRVTVGETLTAELVVTNKSTDQPLTFEDCLHTYFHIGDIDAVTISGLRGTRFLDKTQQYAARTEDADQIRITQETDRIYLDTTAPIEIEDTRLRRRIRIEKSGSNSTVVWNPWIAKSQQMPDFGNDEYRTMVCVESGNVAENKVSLPPGGRSSLKVKISSTPLA
jgi:glucose-6-phosphate 1-epimerase